MLENIKAVKMLGLSKKMSSVVQGLRRAEIKASAAFRKLLVWRVVLGTSVYKRKAAIFDEHTNASVI